MEKKIMYAEIPQFDQEKEYVVQLPPVETDDEIYYGVEVLKLPVDEENKDRMETSAPIEDPML
jgi:hypothetical protein